MTDILVVRNLDAGYAESQVLFGLDLRIGKGEVVTLLGRNGMGKTTTVRAIVGLVKAQTGSIALGGVEVLGRRPYEIARRGVGLVPEGREIFPTLTVQENLIATARRADKGAGYTYDAVCDLFPRLRERRNNLGWQLSGGEQQMLAIARALMTNPQLLILDEATEGLAPTVRDDIWRCLTELRSQGLSMLIIDKNLKSLLAIANRHYVIEKGRMAWSGASDDLRRERDVINRYLTIQR